MLMMMKIIMKVLIMKTDWLPCLINSHLSEQIYIYLSVSSIRETSPATNNKYPAIWNLSDNPAQPEKKINAWCSTS